MEQIRIMERGEEAVQELGTVAFEGAASAEQAALDEAGYALSDHGPSVGNGVRPRVLRQVDGGPERALDTPQSDEGNETTRQTLANVYTDPTRHTVSLLLDDKTANCVIYAVRALAADYEAHAREVRLAGELLPPDSYGAVNRLRIAGRHERIAVRLRMLERNYQSEVSGGWTPTSASDAI